MTLCNILELLRVLYCLSDNCPRDWQPAQITPEINKRLARDEGHVEWADLPEKDATRLRPLSIEVDDLHSKKLVTRLLQQLQDPLVLGSDAFPEWLMQLVFNYPMLFPLEIRQLLFMGTSFGTARALIWLQNQRELLVSGRVTVRNAGSTGTSSGRPGDDSGQSHQQNALLQQQQQQAQFQLNPNGALAAAGSEHLIGRFKHERVKVERNEARFLNWAIHVFRFHADKKAVLEVRLYILYNIIDIFIYEGRSKSNGIVLISQDINVKTFFK